MIKILISFILTSFCALNLSAQLEKVAESHKQVAYVDLIFEGDNGEYFCTHKDFIYKSYIFNHKFEKVTEVNLREYKKNPYLGVEMHNNSISHYWYAGNKVYRREYNFSTKESDLKITKLSDLKYSVYSKFECHNKSIYAFVFNKKNKKYYGGKYDSKTGETQAKFDVDIDEIKDIGAYDNQKSYFLKDGRVVTLVSYTLKDPRKKGVIFFLFDKELKLLSKYVYKRELYVDLNVAVNITQNTELHDEEVYLWSRDVISNSMHMLKCSFEGDKINPSNNRLLLENISFKILNPTVNEKFYTSVFQQIVTSMKEDNYIENPGTGYKIENIYKQGNYTYINYSINQYVKGGAEGVLYLCGVFKLDNSESKIENLIMECYFLDYKSKNDESEYFPIHTMLCMQKSEKLYYFYVQMQQLKGFIIQDGANIKELEPQTFENPFKRKLQVYDVSLFPVYKMNKVVVKVGTKHLFNFDYTVYEF
jgi:hypothetical protein